MDDDEQLDSVHAVGPWARVYGGRINNVGQTSNFHAAAAAWTEAAARWDEAAAWTESAGAHYRIGAAHWQEALCALAVAETEVGADYIEAKVSVTSLVEARAAIRMAIRAREMAGNAHNKSRTRAKEAHAAEGVAIECELADVSWIGMVKEPRGGVANIAKAEKANTAATLAGERAQVADAAAKQAAKVRSWYDPTAVRKAAEGSSAWAEWANWTASLYATNTTISVAYVQALATTDDSVMSEWIKSHPALARRVHGR